MCVGLFTELLPDNALTKSVTICTDPLPICLLVIMLKKLSTGTTLFALVYLKLAISQIVWRRTISWLENSELEKCLHGSDLGLMWSPILTFAWSYWGKQYVSVRIVDQRTKIWTRGNRNTNPECDLLKSGFKFNMKKQSGSRPNGHWSKRDVEFWCK
jgi:hypothetical protein